MLLNFRGHDTQSIFNEDVTCTQSVEPKPKNISELLELCSTEL